MGGQPGPPLGWSSAPPKVRNESPSAYLDLGLWSQEGIPLKVVARGLLRAAERARWNGPAGAAPRSLRACRPEVDAEIEAWKLRSIGAGPTGDDDGV